MLTTRSSSVNARGSESKRTFKRTRSPSAFDLQTHQSGHGSRACEQLVVGSVDRNFIANGPNCVRVERTRRRDRDDVAPPKHGDPSAQLPGFFERVGREQYRLALPRHELIAYERADTRGMRRIDGPCRFIEDQQLRIAEQGARDSQPLLHSRGEGVEPAVEIPRKVDQARRPR